MKIIQKMSYGSAGFLTAQLQQNHQKRSEYYFGFQVIYQSIIKVAVLFALALILGTLKTVIFIILSFTTLRFFAGGIHMNTYAKCLLITLVAFMPASLICNYFIPGRYISLLIDLCTIILATIVIIQWAPKDSPINQITDKAKKTLKIASLGLLIAWSIIALILSIIGRTEIATSICCGLLIETSTILPAGVRIYNKIDKIIK